MSRWRKLYFAPIFLLIACHAICCELLPFTEIVTINKNTVQNKSMLPWKSLKINKRAGMFIPHSRVHFFTINIYNFSRFLTTHLLIIVNINCKPSLMVIWSFHQWVRVGILIFPNSCSICKASFNSNSDVLVTRLKGFSPWAPMVTF